MSSLEKRKASGWITDVSKYVVRQFGFFNPLRSMYKKDKGKKDNSLSLHFDDQGKFLFHIIK